MHQHIIEPLFSTPLYSSNLKLTTEEKSTIKNLDFRSCAKDAKEYNENHGLKELKPTDAGYISNNLKVLDILELSNLKDQVQQHINYYAHKIVGIDTAVRFLLTESWVMKHQKGDWAPLHSHSHSIFSGVLYIECDIDSGAINFVKNNLIPTILPPVFDFEIEESNLFNQKVKKILPTEGELIIFPSHLDHNVDVSNSNNDRYCIAFNTFAKGQIGPSLAL